MKKMKLNILSISLMLLITLLILVPHVQESNALPKEFKEIQDGYKGHLIRVYLPETMSFTTSEASHVFHGWLALTKEQLKDLEPFEVKVYLDGEEIELDNCEEKIGSGQDKTYNVWFYQTFETYYFAPGIYNWTVVWSDATGVVLRHSHPLTVLNDPHRIVVYNHDTMIISSMERSYFKHGWLGITEEDLINSEPLNVQVLLDGVEVESYQIKEEVGENIYDIYFYQYFDAGYFEPGIYNWTVVWSDVTGIVWRESYPLIVLNDPHRIDILHDIGSMTITTSERSYIEHGFMSPVEAFDDPGFYDNLPINVQLYLDGQEIELYQKLKITYDEFNNPTKYYWLFYYYFDNGYFEADMYNWTVVWSDRTEDLILQHPLIVLEDPHRLNLYDPVNQKVVEESLVISTLERCYLKHGWHWPAEQMGVLDFYDNLPCEFKLYIDEQEIDLYQRVEIEYDEENNPTDYRLYFYHNFDADYFDLGIYKLTGAWNDLTETFTNSHPLVVLGEGHRLSVLNPSSLTITALERSYIMHGIEFAPESYKDPYFYEEMPYDVQVFIDGEIENDVYQKLEINYDGSGNPVSYKLLFYKTFAAYYFEPDVHNLEVKWLDANGVVQHCVSKPLNILEDGHQLNMFLPETLEIFESESSYIRHGWMWTPEMFGDEEFYESRPYETNLTIGDDVDIELFQNLEIIHDEFGDPSAYYLLFYRVFEKNHFLPDDYVIVFEWKEIGDNEIFRKEQTLIIKSDI